MLFRLLLTLLLPLLAACAAGPTAPTETESTRIPATAPTGRESAAAADPEATAREFWNCMAAARAEWAQRSRYQKFLSSEIGAALAAANACGAAHLPPWNPDTHPPEDGADVAACLEREHARYQALGFPRPPKVGAATFADQGLTKICYIGERIPEFGFSEEFLQERQRIRNGS